MNKQRETENAFLHIVPSSAARHPALVRAHATYIRCTCCGFQQHFRMTSDVLSLNNIGKWVEPVMGSVACEKTGHASIVVADGIGSATSTSSFSSSTLLPSLSGGAMHALGLDGSSWHSASVLANVGDSSEINGDDLGVSDRSINQCHNYCTMHDVQFKINTRNHFYI